MLSLTHFISSMGCAWNTNDGENAASVTTICSASSSDENQQLSFRKLSYPSFSLSHDDDDEQEEEQQEQEQQQPRREDVQSKASSLMARKVVLVRDEAALHQEQEQEEEQPLVQRIMLENFLDSFDQLVDARIRAYARILANHVTVLSEANNTRGARIAEYKLQTLLEFAANNVQFDSTSTEFCVVLTNAATEDCDGDCDVDGDGDITTTSTTGTEETRITLPIELTVEIHSVRFHDPTTTATATATTRSSKQGNQEEEEKKLIFKAKGEVRADRILIGGTSEKNCHDAEYSFENIQIDIDCDVLLSQMMEEASNVVTMAVELTNLAWTNNKQKHQELNNIMSSSSLTNMNDNDNNNINATRTTVNIIADDDDEDARELHHDHHSHSAAAAATDEVSGEDEDADSVASSSVEFMENYLSYHAHPDADAAATATATFTNLDVVHQDTERKSRRRDFVSVDHTVESSSFQECPTEDTGHDHDNDNNGVESNLLEEYYKITAERACSIVDFAFATPSPSKKPRIE